MNTILAKFTITLSKAYDEDIVVNYSTRDGTAVAGNDYVAVDSEVTIPFGQTSVDVFIEIYQSVIETAPKTFFVDLEPSGQAVLGDRTAECIITVDTDGTLVLIQLFVPTGPQGAPGKSAYQIAVEEGFAGTQEQWIDNIIDQYINDTLLVYIDDDEIGVKIRTLENVLIDETEDTVILNFGF